MNTNQLCADAMQSIKTSINRSAGQHMRQMREKYQPTDAEFLSDLLYAAHMGELPESTIKEACERFNISYPPVQYKGNQATHKAPVVQTKEVNHGICCI